ncbi:MAG: STAS domain-containing protein [Actinomycetota bacterium]
MAATDNLSVTVSDGDPVTLLVEGQIDTYTAVGFNDALVELGGTQAIVVDLSQVTFIDSSGLRVLVRAEKRQAAGGGKLTIAQPSEAVARLLSITGLDTTLNIVT